MDTSCNHISRLGSIVRSSPAVPAKKIQALALLHGEDITGLSKRLGRAQTYLSAVINGNRKSGLLKREIARAYGVSVSDIWTPTNTEEAA